MLDPITRFVARFEQQLIGHIPADRIEQLSNEIQSHLQEATERELSTGISLENAQEAAVREFGSSTMLADAIIHRGQKTKPARWLTFAQFAAVVAGSMLLFSEGNGFIYGMRLFIGLIAFAFIVFGSSFVKGRTCTAIILLGIIPFAVFNSFRQYQELPHLYGSHGVPFSGEWYTTPGFKRINSDLNAITYQIHKQFRSGQNGFHQYSVPNLDAFHSGGLDRPSIILSSTVIGPPSQAQYNTWLTERLKNPNQFAPFPQGSPMNYKLAYKTWQPILNEMQEMVSENTHWGIAPNTPHYHPTPWGYVMYYGFLTAFLALCSALIDLLGAFSGRAYRKSRRVFHLAKA